MDSVTSLDVRLAIIGGGRMGEAIAAGLVGGGTLAPGAITVAEPDGARRADLGARLGVVCVASGVEAAEGADIIVIAVKPQVIDGVVRDIAGAVGPGVVVSIAAGVSTARLESLLPPGTAVVRVMPNTPALVGEGMALVSGGSEATVQQVDVVERMFAALGRTMVMDERYQDAGTAISGSGPAYFALVIDALARGGVAQGLSREVAEGLAVQTMLGTARMLQETRMHPGELMDGVSSPGGTTIAALERLEAHGVRAAFAEAVSAAVRRAKELGS